MLSYAGRGELNLKRVFGWILAIIVIGAVPVGYVAYGLFTESGPLEAQLKEDLKIHAPMADVKKHITDAGFQLIGDPYSASINGKGQKHSAYVLTGWLTVQAKFNEEGHLTAYQIDKANSIP